MRFTNVMNTMMGLISDFFVGATVIFEKQANTQPPLPYVTVKFGDTQRNAFRLQKDYTPYYLYHVPMELNLYTAGASNDKTDGMTHGAINTAVGDMIDFCTYIESEEITDKVAMLGMDVSLDPPVRDLSNLENDSKYRFRSMAEFTVSYAGKAEGWYGLSEMEEENSSGGGSKDMIDKEMDYFDEVEVTEDEGGKDDE